MNGPEWDRAIAGGLRGGAPGRIAPQGCYIDSRRASSAA
jgi:hypothetical protein